MVISMKEDMVTKDIFHVLTNCVDAFENGGILSSKKVAIFGLILPESGDFKATFWWRQKWRFWDPKMAPSKK